MAFKLLKGFENQRKLIFRNAYATVGNPYFEHIVLFARRYCNFTRVGKFNGVVGEVVGDVVGAGIGFFDGFGVGLFVGLGVGVDDGLDDGFDDGLDDGFALL